MFYLKVVFTSQCFLFSKYKLLIKCKTANQCTHVYRIRTFTFHQAPMNFSKLQKCLLRHEIPSHGKKNPQNTNGRISSKQQLPLLIGVQKCPSLLPRSDKITTYNDVILNTEVGYVRPSVL